MQKQDIFGTNVSKMHPISHFFYFFYEKICIFTKKAIPLWRFLVQGPKSVIKLYKKLLTKTTLYYEEIFLFYLRFCSCIKR